MKLTVHRHVTKLHRAYIIETFLLWQNSQCVESLLYYSLQQPVSSFNVGKMWEHLPSDDPCSHFNILQRHTSRQGEKPPRVLTNWLGQLRGNIWTGTRERLAVCHCQISKMLCYLLPASILLSSVDREGCTPRCDDMLLSFQLLTLINS